MSIEDLTPRMFSFNNPFGACPKCTGLGVFLKIDENKIIPDREKSIAQNGIKGSGWAMEGSQIAAMYMEALARRYKFSLTEPIKNIPDSVLDKILYGTGGEKLTIHRQSAYGSGTYEREFEGVITNLDRRYHESSSNWVRDEIRSYMTEIPCDACHGAVSCHSRYGRVRGSECHFCLDGSCLRSQCHGPADLNGCSCSAQLDRGNAVGLIRNEGHHIRRSDAVDADRHERLCDHRLAVVSRGALERGLVIAEQIVLGLAELDFLALCHCIQVVVACHDDVVRDEVERLDAAADHGHCLVVGIDARVDVALCIDVHGLNEQCVVGRVIHRPELAAAGECILGLAAGCPLCHPGRS